MARMVVLLPDNLLPEMQGRGNAAAAAEAQRQPDHCRSTGTPERGQLPETAREELAEWRYHGRLVARQLDDVHLVIRADFDFRDSILRQFPGTFSVPTRYIKHMMVVADLAGGDAGAIEDALEAAWQLQRSAD
jgi:hypothetical protein